MLDQLLSLIGVHRVGLVAGVASQVIRTFEQEFAQDHSAKNAAIDTIIDVLKKQKVVEEAQVAVSPAPVAAPAKSAKAA